MKALHEGSATDRVRFTLYLHKQKHADMCEFLLTLPEGTVSNYLRDLVRLDLQNRGLVTLASPLKASVPTKRCAPNDTAHPAQTTYQNPAQPTQYSAPVTVTPPTAPYSAPVLAPPAPSYGAHPVAPAVAPAPAPVTYAAPPAPAPQPTSATMYTAASAAQPFEPAQTIASGASGNVEPEDISEFIDELIAKF